jgi:hypothetical protein
MKEVSDRVRQRLDQGQRAGNADAIGQKVGDRKCDYEVQDGEAAGLCKAQSKRDAHGALGLAVMVKVHSARQPIHLIMAMASIGRT